MVAIPGLLKSYFGFREFDTLTTEMEKEILNSIIVAPNFTAFVKPHVINIK